MFGKITEFAIEVNRIFQLKDGDMPLPDLRANRPAVSRVVVDGFGDFPILLREVCFRASQCDLLGCLLSLRRCGLKPERR